MGSFGERLRREREMRGISLDEIAAATKIGTRSLRAIEDEEFKKLPGGIFNKGFVRAYAHFLGINEEQAVADYVAAAGEAEPETVTIIAEQLVAKQEAEKAKPRSRELETINDEPSGFPLGAVLALLLVVVAAALGWTLYSRHNARLDAERVAAAQQAPAQETQTPAPIAQESTASPSSPTDQQPIPSAVPAGSQQEQVPATPLHSQPPATTATAQPAPAITQPAAAQSASEVTAVPDGEGFVVSIRATKSAWISVTADGKHVLSGILPPSDAKSIRAHSRLMLKTGNAGGVEVSFNGKPIPPLGGEGEVRQATFTPEGIQQ